MIGDVKTAAELGYRGHALYRLSVCDVCGKERWVRLLDWEQGKGLVCRSCGYPSSNLHRKKEAALREAGAKKASEIGKPVFRKRDPWYYPHICPICGEEVWHQHKDIHRVCKKCAYIARQTKSGENHPNWKGGRYPNPDGYILMQLEPDSAYYPMANDRGYILEHRLVVARHLGRCLLDSEIVHHINGNKADNRIGNLELLPNNASHLPYIMLQQQVMKLEQQIREQDDEIKVLKWRIRQLEQGNPVPSREANNTLSGVRRDYTGGTLA